MARSDQVLRRVRFAYERTHILDGLRGLAIAAGICVLAIGLHRITSTSWLVAAVLTASLGALGWRGGALRRGAFAGVLAGLPTLIVPSLGTSCGPRSIAAAVCRLGDRDRRADRPARLRHRRGVRRDRRGARARRRRRHGVGRARPYRGGVSAPATFYAVGPAMTFN